MHNQRTTVHLEGDNTHLANFCGPLDENLEQIGQAYDVNIRRRGSHVMIEGAQYDNAAQAVQWFHQRAVHKALSIDDIQLGLVELKAQQPEPAGNGSVTDAPRAPRTTAPAQPVQLSDEAFQLRTRKRGLRPRTPKQHEYMSQVLTHDITFGLGPAGTGKTFLAVACAIDALEKESVERIILTRPAVEAGERLGFLPGDLSQKVDPYLRPLYDALYDLMGFERVQRAFEKQIIEIAPLAYMRGRTLNHSFIILDEAQNTTPEQMKMFLTRTGFGSKAVITGDPSQIDLPKAQRSGLMHAVSVLNNVKGIAITELSSKDVVRHPLVARIIDAYEYHDPQPPKTFS
ncbi:MAG TPA: PhoH family protein [Paenalcaligenes sp.]|nr:PhoH family protein [Paenalcaligenes sp.]